MAQQFDIMASGYQFVEAPRVDTDGALYFSDLTGGGYHCRGVDGIVRTVMPDRTWIGGAVLDTYGCLIVSGRGGLVHVDCRTGIATNCLTRLEGTPIVAVNDIEADFRGGICGGTIDFEAILERHEAPRPGHLFHYSAAGRVTLLRDDVIGSNGMDFSPDGNYLYHSESTRGVWIYSLGADGMPGSRQLFAALDDSDGLVVDSIGRIWVACWQSAKILRYRPDGVLDLSIDLPFPYVVSLCFGGVDMTDLYVTTGANESRPAAGGVIRLKSDFPGQPIRRSCLT